MRALKLGQLLFFHLLFEIGFDQILLQVVHLVHDGLVLLFKVVYDLLHGSFRLFLLPCENLQNLLLLFVLCCNLQIFRL